MESKIFMLHIKSINNHLLEVLQFAWLYLSRMTNSDFECKYYYHAIRNSKECKIVVLNVNITIMQFAWLYLCEIVVLNVYTKFNIPSHKFTFFSTLITSKMEQL